MHLLEFPAYLQGSFQCQTSSLTAYLWTSGFEVEVWTGLVQATLWNCHCHPVESVLSYVNTRAAYVAGVVRVAQRIALDSCGALGIGGELCHVIAVIYDLELGITV